MLLWKPLAPQQLFSIFVHLFNTEIVLHTMEHVYKVFLKKTKVNIS